MESVIAFVFGTLIGSFLNVVVLRYNTGRGITGRSGCPACGVQLRWFELLPVVSFLVQTGRCRSCHSKISWQYPLVELSMGLLTLGVFLLSGVSGLYDAVFYEIIWALLVVIFVYDIHHKIIPDGFVFSLGALSFARLFVFASGAVAVPSAVSVLSGLYIALPLALLWLVSRGRWMGLGDAKLALSFGWLLGLSGGISALLVAFWSGALVSIGILVWNMLASRRSSHIRALSRGGTRLTMKSEIPFAPFLIFGCALVFFFHIDIVSFLFS
jgi:leader peptidase (prepilin peptidase)/N-methyltransferase